MKTPFLSQNNRPFLDQVVEYLQSQLSAHENHLFVFPNKRSIQFFTQKLKKKNTEAICLPQTIDINAFYQNLSSISVMDSTELILKFYAVYKDLKAERADVFEVFEKWGRFLLQDFNELDSQIIDADDFFNYIEHYFATQAWSPDKSELTPFQKKYLHFWKEIKIYYSALTASFVKESKGTRGFMLRALVKELKARPSKRPFMQNKKVIFVGFNAFTKAEEKIIDLLHKSNETQILFDADQLYVKNKENIAGHFIRRYRMHKNWNTGALKPSEALSLKEKAFFVSGYKNNHDMAKDLPGITEKYTNAAIIVCDESILPSILSAFKDKKEYVNASLGLSLHHTQAYSLCVLFFRLISSFDKEYKCSSTDFLRFVNHPLHINQDAFFTDKIHANYLKHKRFISVHEIGLFLKRKDHPLSLSTQNKSICNLYDLLVLFSDFYFEQSKGDLEKESFSLLKSLCENLSKKISSYTYVLPYDTLFSLLEQQIRQTYIALISQKQDQIQIMGLLETRLLDFEHLIFVSLNEGHLPMYRSENSFIPQGVKKMFGLTTYKIKEAIFSYHFYRLIQKASNVHLLYLKGKDALGGQMQKSRYILQMEHLSETLPAIRYTEINHHETLISKEEIEKTYLSSEPFIREQLQALALKGYSASSCIRLINCSLNFLYQTLLSLNAQEQTQELDAIKIGEIAHEVLYLIYAPMIGQNIKASLLSDALQNLEGIIQALILKRYSLFYLNNSRDKIKIKLLTHAIENFISSEIKQLKKTSIHLLEAEIEMATVLEVNAIEIQLKGVIDRVEIKDNCITIIDFKTGHFKPEELVVTDIAMLFNETKNKAFQLMFYAYLYFSNHRHKAYTYQLRIVSLKNSARKSYDLQIGDQKVLTKEHINAFESQLVLFFKRLYFDEFRFSHHPTSKYCAYCG